MTNKLKKLQDEFIKVERYNVLMRYSFSRKGILLPEEQSELEDLKEYFEYGHTAQVALKYSDQVLLEYEVLTEEFDKLAKHIDKLEYQLSKPKKLFGVFNAR
jgi:hypothetical protein